MCELENGGLKKVKQLKCLFYHPESLKNKAINVGLIKSYSTHWEYFT